MSSLDELFPDAGNSRVVVGQHEARLDALVGEASVVAPIDHEAERQRLQSLIGPAGTATLVGDARAVAALPAAAATRTKARSRFLRKQRRDWLTTTVGIVAVAAVAIAGLMGVRTAMASTPTDDSRAMFTDSEEALSSTISAANAERARMETALQEALTQGQVATTSLAGLAGVADEPLRLAAVAAVDGYHAGVREIELPPALESYSAAQIAADATLIEIGTALETVDALQIEADAAKAEFRELNASLVSLRDAVGAAAKPLADSLIALAGAEVVQRTAALPEFRAAAQSAANALAGARSTGRLGWIEMQVLSDAIRALRVDDERALLEVPDEGGTDGSWTSPGDSGGSPTPDPGPVDPGPVDPGPVDPGPVDPGPVDPDPTEPDGDSTGA